MAELEQEIELLRRTSREQLKARWRELYKAAPPAAFTPDLLARGIAWRLQEKTLGGLTPDARRLLGGSGEGGWCIRDTWRRHQDMIDTHTADGLKVGREKRKPGVPMIVLETALPAKFAETIQEALGRQPTRPAALEGIEALPKRFTVMPVDAERVKAFVTERCA